MMNDEDHITKVLQKKQIDDLMSTSVRRMPTNVGANLGRTNSINSRKMSLSPKAIARRAVPGVSAVAHKKSV